MEGSEGEGLEQRPDCLSLRGPGAEVGPLELTGCGSCSEMLEVLPTLHCHMSTGSMKSPPILAALRLYRFNELIPQITESIPNYNHRQSDSLRARLCNHCF